jgi:sugar phosphate isomerase/epimerase
MKLSYAVALSDCKAKKMRCFRGDLDAMCAQIQALGYDGVELFASNPDGAGAAGHAVTAPFHDNRQDGQDWQDAGME